MRGMDGKMFQRLRSQLGFYQVALLLLIPPVDGSGFVHGGFPDIDEAVLLRIIVGQATERRQIASSALPLRVGKAVADITSGGLQVRTSITNRPRIYVQGVRGLSPSLVELSLKPYLLGGEHLAGSYWLVFVQKRAAMLGWLRSSSSLF